MKKRKIDTTDLLKMVSLNSVELLQERQHLRQLGLTQEEVEGYIEFYWNNWFPPVNSGRVD
jgi:hypothetical protein